MVLVTGVMDLTQFLYKQEWFLLGSEWYQGLNYKGF
jgi:hypothetical protein